MPTKKADALRELSKPKLISNNPTNKNKNLNNSVNVKKTTMNNSNVGKSTTKKPVVLSSANPNKGRPRTTSLGSHNIQNKSKSKNSSTSGINTSKATTTNTLNKTTSNSKLTIKPKTSANISLSSKSSLSPTNVKSTSTTLKTKTSSTLKTKASSTLKSKTSTTLKPKESKEPTTIKSKTSSTLKSKSSTTLKPKTNLSSTSSRLSSISSVGTTKKVKPSTTTNPSKVKLTVSSVGTPSKTKSTIENSSTSNTLKPKTTLTSKSTNSTNLKLKPPTTSSKLMVPNSSPSLKKPSKPKSNLSTISNSSSISNIKANSTITSRLTTSPTPYSSQNSTTSSSTSSVILVRKKKPSPYANVKAKVNSLPSSRASSSSSTSTIRAKNSISDTKDTSLLKKSSTSLINKTSPSKSTISSTANKSKILETSVKDINDVKKEEEPNLSKDNNSQLVTSLSKTLQDKKASIKLNDITPIETPVSTSPIVAPCITINDTDKIDDSSSIPPTPITTPKQNATVTRSNSSSTNNEILDEYIKNIKYDPATVKRLDPNALTFPDNEENVDKERPLSFIADTKHYDDISVSTDDFLDCESNFSDAKSSLISPKLNVVKLSKVSSISNLSTISSLSSITHKSSNNSFTSSVSISTLKSIFDNAVTNPPTRPIQVPSSTPKVKKLNPQTLQLFEKQTSTEEPKTTGKINNKSAGSLSTLKNKNGLVKNTTTFQKNTSLGVSRTSGGLTSTFGSPTLKQTPLMKAVKSRVDSNFGSISKISSTSSAKSLTKPTLSKVSSSSSVSSLNKPTLSKVSSSSSISSLNKPTISKVSSTSSVSSLNKPTVSKVASTSSVSSLNKPTLSKVSTRSKTPSSIPSPRISITKASSSVNSITRTKTPSSTSSTTRTKTPTLLKTSSTTGSLSKTTSSLSSRTKTPTLSKSPSTTGSLSKSSSSISSLSKNTLAKNKITSINTNTNTTVSKQPIHLSPSIPRRNTRITSLQPNTTTTTTKKVGVNTQTIIPKPPASNAEDLMDDDYDDDDEFKDSVDGTFLLDHQEYSAEPESYEINKNEDSKAIPSYVVKKHTLDQSQICEISEDSFILNQYVEDHHYYQTKHSYHQELIGDIIHAEDIIDQVKQEEMKKEALSLEKINKVEATDPKESVTENEELNKTEPINIEIENEEIAENDDEDGMSLSSISVKKLIKKNISNIMKPKNFTSLIKKKSSMEMNESFESNSNNSFSDNNSDVSVTSDSKRDSKGSTSYVFSMFMQSLNGANNLIKKKRNSGNFDDMKITISGPYQDDDVKSSVKIDDTKSEAESVVSSLAPNTSKTVIVPLNTTLEIPKRVSSAVPFSDDESVDSSTVNTSLKQNTIKNNNSPMKLDISSNIQSTPLKLINKSVEKNKDKRISADSAIYLGDSITYENIKEVINEEWNETINKQKFGVSNILEESEGENNTNILSPSTSISSSKTCIQNNQILMNLSVSHESLASTTIIEENSDLLEAKEAIQKHLKKINNIICEIASTEKTYVNELSKLIEIYYYPMEQNQVLNNNEMNYLYSNIVNIYQFHSEIFYPKLDLVQKEHEKNIKLINEMDALKSDSSIKLINESISIEAFFKIVIWPFQFLYKPYYVNFKKASDFVSILNNNQKQKYSSDDVLIQAEELGFANNCPIFERENKKKFKKLKSFLKSCTERMDHHQVDILGYLILPIQRLPRYLLLLESLAKSTKLLEEATSKLIPKTVVNEPILDKKTNNNKSRIPSSTISKKENKNISKLKENLNKSSNAKTNNIEARKVADRTDRAKKAPINVKSMIAQIESTNNNSINNKTMNKSGNSRLNNNRTNVKGGKNSTVTSRVNSNLPKSKTIHSNLNVNSVKGNNNNNKSMSSPTRSNAVKVNNTINRNKTKTTTNSNLGKGLNNKENINRPRANSTVNRNNTKMSKNKTIPSNNANANTNKWD
ncbi:hypothetical protein BCR32DRAFT_249292 [Anaeromyces robustus]|uniref:DH domain-containing protein n=1 Tax=Anaeromyces robustus TaxID=1754192 RepID=A0A1Y1WQU0_9FUNG|nr:hypothetical protein BCR32DRAFT_249292 [Anaeromyces robustus]|eukprot:ORX75755.1 hypothetical protein BCR32DRAFT_249292 [Anaeromyces robustus]